MNIHEARITILTNFGIAEDAPGWFTDQERAKELQAEYQEHSQRFTILVGHFDPDDETVADMMDEEMIACAKALVALQEIRV